MCHGKFKPGLMRNEKLVGILTPLRTRSPIKNLWNVMGGQTSYVNTSTKPKQRLHTLKARNIRNIDFRGFNL